MMTKTIRPVIAAATESDDVSEAPRRRSIGRRSGLKSGGSLTPRVARPQAAKMREGPELLPPAPHPAAMAPASNTHFRSISGASVAVMASTRIVLRRNGFGCVKHVVAQWDSRFAEGTDGRPPGRVIRLDV